MDTRTIEYKSRVEYQITDTSQTTYNFPFKYLRKKFIKVQKVDENKVITEFTYGVDYTVSNQTITLTGTQELATTDTLVIYRDTDTTGVVTWTDGSILLSEDMTAEQVQNLHLIEEAQDYLASHSLTTRQNSEGQTTWDALGMRISDVADPTEPQDVVTKHYMESVQDGFVQRNQAIETHVNEMQTDVANKQQQTSASQSAAKDSENKAKAWAVSTGTPDNAADTDSSTGKTQSSRTWALFSKSKAQAAKTSEQNAKISETKALTSEQNAKTSETKALTSEQNAKTSATHAKSSEINASASASDSASSARASATSAANAKTSETNAAKSAKQAAESAGVFQDFTGATSTTDGTSGKVPKPFAGQQEKFLKADGTWGDIAFQDFKGATSTTDGTSGKVPKPLAGQQNKVLKADGTWGDGVTPQTLWKGMHSYPVNYVPADVSNAGWNKLGLCSIYYTTHTIKNPPTQKGQLINIPADENNESAQLWIAQSSGNIFTRGGDSTHAVNDTYFRRFVTFNDITRLEGVETSGNDWVRYTSGLQMCWNHTFNTDATWSYPVPFNVPPTVQATVLNQNSVSVALRDVSNTRVYIMSDRNTSSRYPVSVLAIGRWK